MIRAPLRRLSPRPGQGDGGDGEDAVPDGNPQGAAEAGAGDDHGGDEQPGQDVEGVAVEGFGERGRGSSPRARKTAATALDMLVTAARTMVPAITPGTAQRAPSAEAVRSMAALAATTTPRVRTGGGSVSRAALVGVDGVG